MLKPAASVLAGMINGVMVKGKGKQRLLAWNQENNNRLGGGDSMW